MARPTELVSRVGGRRVVLALGALYVSLAAGSLVVELSRGRPLSNVLLVSLFVAVPGFVVLYGGYSLPYTDIRPNFYPLVAAWCLAGLGLMFASILLYQLEPAESINNPVRGLLVLTAFGTLAGFGVGSRDALARTRALAVERRNEQLKRTRAELRRAVERLERANDELEESNERLEEFAHAVSHDLREPLRMVTNYLSLVAERYGERLDEEGREFVGYAVDGADRMAEMIDGLLDVSRVGTRGDPFAPVDMNDVLADVRRDLEVQIRERDATVEVGDLPRVLGDSEQLRQLVQNLVSNALKYAGEDPPRVGVTGRRSGDSDVVVAVRDEGIGMDPADTDRVFEPFNRLHTREEYDGTGIGLALCERIVERHGGEIRIDSAPGEGTTVTFTLSAATADAPSTPDS